MSGTTEAMPSAGPNSAKSGKVARSRSPCWMPYTSLSAFTCAAKTRNGVTTPLGTPVLPLVNRIAAVCSGSG